MIGRVVPFLVADGPTQMALDEFLLETIAAEPSAAVFRTYAWSQPTLSLGYFQSHVEVGLSERWRGAPLVRRTTGGGAIWHDRELTYALVLPRSHALASRPQVLYHTVHTALVELIRQHGGDTAQLAGSGQARSSRPLLCFVDRDEHDVILAGTKVVGSAQRRRAGAVLQHGSILLGRSERTPELPGLAELLPAPPSRADLSLQVQERLATALGLTLVPAALTPEERDQVEALACDRYRSEGWTRKR